MFKGIASDFNYIDQPEGTYPYALNAVRRSGEGDFEELVNERGFQLCSMLPAGYEYLGSAYVGDETFVIFSANPEGGSEIGIFNKFCEYETFLNTDCLGFDVCRRIQAVFRLREGCKRTVYFTDRKRLRVLDIDDKDIAVKVMEEGCNAMRLIPCFDAPCMDFQVKSGGQIVEGSYSFYFSYSDSNGNSTTFFDGSLPINIFVDGSFVNIGADGSSFEVLPRKVSKRVEIQISGADRSFDYYRIGIAKFNSRTGQVSSVVISPLQPISQSLFVYDGNENGYTPGTIEQLTAIRADIESADHLRIFEKRLLVTGIKGTEVDLCKFQRKVSKIQAFYNIRSVAKEEYENEAHPANELYMEFATHPRDEIISLAMEFVLDCGYVTPAFPLIGTPKDVNFLSCDPARSPDIPDVPAECSQQLVVTGVSFDDIVKPDPTEVLEYSLIYRVIDDRGIVVGGNLPSDFPNLPPRLILTHIFQDTGFFTRVFGSWPCDYTIEIVSLTILSGGGYADANVVTDDPDSMPSRDPDIYMNNKDSDIIPAWIPDIEHLVSRETFNSDYGKNEADREAGKPVIERWQVYNTAIRFSEGGGQFGYYQCPTTYPEIPTCDGEDYWGVDACGNPITGTPIRQFRVPDARLEPLTGAGGISNTTQYCLTTLLPLAVSDGQGGTISPIRVRFEYSVGGVAQDVTQEYIIGPRTQRKVTVECFGDFIPSLDSFVATILTEGYETADALVGVIEEGTSSTTIEGEVMRLVGITIRGVEVPEEYADRVVGYHLLIAVSDGQETVVDNGYMSKFTKDEEFEGFGWMGARDGDDSSRYAFMSDKVSYNQELSDGDYIKFNTEYKVLNHENDHAIADQDGLFDTSIDWFFLSALHFYGQRSVSLEPHMKINRSFLMTPTQELNLDGQRIFNLSIDNSINMIDTVRNYDLGSETQNKFLSKYDKTYVTIKRDINVYCNLEGLTYRRLHNCLRTGYSGRFGGGNSFITPFRRTNTFLYTAERGVLDNIFKLIASVVGVVVGIAIGSPAVIIASVVNFGVEAYKGFLDKRWNSRERFDKLLKLPAVDGLVNVLTQGKSIIFYVSEGLEGLWSESKINSFLREDSAQDCFTYFRERGDFISYMKSKLLVYDDENRLYQLRPLPCVEWYSFNKDFARVNDDDVSFPIPINYDCCNECQNEYPHRTHWSLPSFEEERVDQFRVFLPINYKDVSGEHGPITNIWVAGRNLMITCRETTYQQPSGAQSIRTDGGLTAYLGTGAFLALDEVELIDSELGSAGCQDKWSFVEGPFGTLWVDTLDGKVWLYGEGMERISDYFEFTWFERHLKSHLKKQIYDLTRYEYDCDPSGGIGIISAYDSKEERYIITKRDYIMRPNVSFRVSDQTFRSRSGQKVMIGDPDYFENKSWTRSYDPKSKSWVSFHSYMPKFYISGKREVFAGLDNKIWKLNQEGIHHIYFGIKYPCIIEQVIRAEEGTAEFHDVRYYATARMWNPILEDYVEKGDVTFNAAVFYNSRQCSGLVDLVNGRTASMVDLTTQISNRLFVNRMDRDWSINGMVDLVANYDEPMFARDWASIRENYFTDKVVNPNVIDLAKDWLNIANFKDKFLVVRFILNDRHDVKHTFFITNSQSSRI